MELCDASLADDESSGKTPKLSFEIVFSVIYLSWSIKNRFTWAT
jgi:hypothetical protein